MSGAELAAEGRHCRPGLKVLYTSDYPRDTIVHNDRLHAGAQLLAKPYTRQDLARAVHSLLDTKRED